MISTDAKVMVSFRNFIFKKSGCDVQFNSTMMEEEEEEASEIIFFFFLS